MPASAPLSLWAVHIADGVLTWPWLLSGFVGAAALALGAVAVDTVRSLLRGRSVHEDEIALTAVLPAVFFVASLIHVPLGPTRVHLLLNGLLGVVLGWRAALAIPVGLLLQAALFGHGGFTTLGVNSCVMTLPALLAWGLFALLWPLPWLRRPWFRTLLVAVSGLAWTWSLAYGIALLRFSAAGASAQEQALAAALHPLTLAAVGLFSAFLVWGERRLENSPEFPLGLLVGVASVLATVALNGMVLLWGGQENWRAVALSVFLAHLPVVLVEGVVLGFTVGFLARVKPELLRGVAAGAPEPLRPSGRSSDERFTAGGDAHVTPSCPAPGTAGDAAYAGVRPGPPA
jgi:cobalt/nickel transport system permease protein